MPILRKPEEIVIRIMNRLRKAKELAVEQETDDWKQNQLVSKFQVIEKDLQTMDGLLPKVKSIEKDLMEQFMRLEGVIDDDMFKHHGKFDEIIQKLELVSKNIQSVKSLTSSVKLELSKLNNASDDTPVTQHIVQSLEVQYTMGPQDWARLITADNLFRSDVNNSLRHNFNLIGTESQFCLLSLSIFPENCVLKKRPITYWWLAEGFHDANSEGSTAEEVGDRILQELIHRRLISANRPQFMDSFTVHPWIRCMLISVAMEKGLFNFDAKGNLKSDQRQAFFCSDNQEYLHHVHNGNGIRPETLVTVFNINQRYLSFTADWLSRLKKVVVLQLGRWQSSPKHHIEIENEESLKGLGALKHLRYLSLRGISRIFTLPRSVTHLFGLEILDLRACHNLEKLPSNISSLRNLTHLDISECYLLESMPNGLGKLSKLQVLKGFIVGNTSKASSKISDLAGLKKLRKLGVSIATNAVVEEGEFNNLQQISSLRNLTISWGTVSSSPNLQDAMRSLALPTSLRKLDLRYIPEDTLPEWVDLHKLKDLEKLYIKGGQLKSLRYVESDRLSIKILRLKYLKGLTVSEQQLKEMFPDAVYLEAIQCHDADILWNKDDDEKVLTTSL